MNFFVKVHAGEGRHIHLRIYRDLQGNVSLNNLQVISTVILSRKRKNIFLLKNRCFELQADKTREDTLEYF